MNWRGRVVSSPNVLHGKPRVQGTRVEISAVLEGVATGHSPTQIVELYPSLTEADVHAAIAFAAELSRDHAATRLAKRARAWELSPKLEAELLESIEQAERGEVIDAEVVLAKLRSRSPVPAAAPRAVRNQRIKRAPLDEWVNDNNPPREAEYAPGYWDLVEFARHMESRFEARGLFAVGTHVIFTPPPEEELVVPIVCIELDGASVVLEFDFAEWPDQWRAGVKLDRPRTGPTLGLFDVNVGAGRDPADIEELGVLPPYAENQRGFSCRLGDEWDVASLLRVIRSQ